MITKFTEEALEDLLVENIKALNLRAQSKMLSIDFLEGNRIDPNNPESALSYRQVPNCLVGITGIPSTEAQDNLKTQYRLDFDLAVVISAYDKRRKSGKLSDIRLLREAIRKEIYGNNPYKIGNSVVILELTADDQLIQIENVIVYVQTYTGKFPENT